MQVPPDCVTVYVLSLTVRVPLRAAVESLAATVNPTEPFWVPLWPNEIVIQGTLLNEVH